MFTETVIQLLHEDPKFGQELKSDVKKQTPQKGLLLKIECLSSSLTSTHF